MYCLHERKLLESYCHQSINMNIKKNWKENLLASMEIVSASCSSPWAGKVLKYSKAYLLIHKADYSICQHYFSSGGTELRATSEYQLFLFLRVYRPSCFSQTTSFHICRWYVTTRFSIQKLSNICTVLVLHHGLLLDDCGSISWYVSKHHCR
jgi:hypothetical protein